MHIHDIIFIGGNMDFMNDIDNNTLLIVPKHVKKEILINNKHLVNIKFMTLTEFKNNYLFTYDSKAIYYLMDKYKIKYDIAKMYLDNMIYVENNNIDNDHLNKLIVLKKELDNENLIIYNPYFKDYLKGKKIIICGYYLNLFEYNLIKSLDNYKIINEQIEPKQVKVYEFENLEEEIVFVALKIIDLINKNIDIKKIKLCNVNNDDKVIIKRIFKFFNIPIYFKENLYKINSVLKFLDSLKENNNINESLNLINDEDVLKIVVDVLNQNYFENYNDKIVIQIIENIFKNKNVDIKKNQNVVECIDLEEVSRDNFVFLIGFNQGSIPKIYKDEEYLTDKIRIKLGIDTSITNNKREKEKVKNFLNKIDNLIISYRLKSPYEIYIKNTLTEELDMTIVKSYIHNSKFNYSDIYNKLVLANDLDNLIKYNLKSNELDMLFNNYKIPYKNYDNKFTGINKNNLLNYLDNKLLLSYSSLDNYYRCGFKFYIKNILKLEKYEETFAIFIGNLFHDILSKAFIDGFDLEKEFNKFLIDRELSVKEIFFINKLKKDLLFVIETIKEQNKYSKFDKELYEEKIYINKDKNIKITFMGIVDKIKILKENHNNYIAIIDYKTGNPETNLSYTMYGINMQLPVYLYLVSNSQKIENAKVVGFYLQKIINSEVKKCEDVNQKKKDGLKLDGFSLDDTKILEKFDITYNESKVIKGMKTSSKGFYAYSKVLSEKQINKLIEIVNEKIDKASMDVINAKFDINPKRIGNKLVGCEFCNYKDLCYRKEKDIINLEEDRNCTFLGSDIDG